MEECWFIDSGLGSTAGQGSSVVFMGKTLCSHVQCISPPSLPADVSYFLPAETSAYRLFSTRQEYGLLGQPDKIHPGGVLSNIPSCFKGLKQERQSTGVEH